MQTTDPSVSERLAAFATLHPEAADLLRRSLEEQQAAGYFHTLHEILQQPATWVDTCERLSCEAALLEAKLSGICSVVLTGSGSSQFAGECVCGPLQKELGIPAVAIDGGSLLMHGGSAIGPRRPALVISLARSGDSPESVGAVSLLLESEPQIRHLVLTCNANGGLARTSSGEARVHTVVLDGRTNDRSLVMTSSFTNLALAARALAFVHNPDAYRATAVRLSALCDTLFERHFGSIARAGSGGFERAVYLGTGPRFGAAREAALKMLEMTAGRVATIPETYLGLRHGPMSYIHGHTMVVCFLSSDPLLRAYESDLIDELNRKKLGNGRVLVGESIDRNLVRASDSVIELAGMDDAGDDNTAILHAVVGQLLAFFRCRREGLKPDSPSEEGVISRVVGRFPLHRRGGRADS